MTSSTRFTLSQTGEFWLACILVFFTAVSIRITELSLWMDAAFFVNGEHLMATHDAYAWLAGAKGIGQWSNAPFSLVLQQIQAWTGLNLAFIGFWAPLVFIPLLAVPVCLLAKNLRLPEGGLVFGILATSGLGFLVRTRLGFCDTDIINLLFPVSSLCLLAIWLGDFFSTPQKASTTLSSIQSAGVALMVGLAGKAALWFYPGSSSVLLPGFCLAIGMAFFLRRADARMQFVNGLLLILGISFAGWAGGLLAGGWMLLHKRIQNVLPVAAYWITIICLGTAIVFLGNLDGVVSGLVYRLYLYTKAGTPDMVNNATGLKLPDIAQSVREAQNLDWSLLGPRLGGNWIVFVLGLAGFGFVCWRRPALLVFLPFLVLGLASMKLGNRFAMYGTVGIGMGLGLGLSELLAMLKQSQGRRWIAQLLVACVVLWPSADLMQRVSPVPVLPQTYAQTFLDLKKLAEPDALLWQWWDYGYAGQYYAERATMGDGARQSGPWLYPLAKAHCATSPREAAQIMRYFGQSMLDAGSRNTTDVRVALLKGNPVTAIQQQDATITKQFLANLAKAPTVATAVPNYFVVSWENLRLGGWIGYYGHWDIVAGASSAGKIQQLRGEVRIDSESGMLFVNGKNLPVDTLDIVEDEGTRHFDWAQGVGAHLLMNQRSRQVFFMDSAMYNSMMVQMLIAPPQNFAEDFTLVVDKYPWARAYKVKG